MINFAAKSSAGALRVVLASLVQLPFSGNTCSTTATSPGSDPISLALALWVPCLDCLSAGWDSSLSSTGNDTFGGQGFIFCLLSSAAARSPMPFKGNRSTHSCPFNAVGVSYEPLSPSECTR